MVKRTKRYTKRRGRKGARGTRRKGFSRKRARSRSNRRRTRRTRRRVGVFSGKNTSATNKSANAPKASAKRKIDSQPKKCKLCGKEGVTWKECTNKDCYMHQFTKNNKWLPPEEITTKRGEKIMIKKLTDSAIAQVRQDHPELFEKKKKKRQRTT